ncbi:hypothetical protein TSAR_014772 [Trichomalopsis sarcophagae]|uniref:Cyclin N-terminal domain-containing protein n=1 Tax=Trichomalopsis sarcophagae TaxID=543379 RepID=A0A232FLA9_9HYME|nr:hypothetical protein TSAR_014772 [Trichomalopsis sarcophagae]
MARDLEYSYIGPYLRDWLEYVRKKNDADQQMIADGNEFRVPFVGVQTEMIQMIFLLSSRYDLEPQAKHMAVHLLDQYMARLFWEIVSNSPKLNDKAAEKQLRDKMSSQVRLVMVICLQIASKVDLYKTGLDVEQVQNILKWVDSKKEYNKSSICSCEKRILEALDWRLPICLPIDAVELFLVYADLASKPKVRDSCLRLLDVAYLRHAELFEQMHLLATGRPYDKSLRVCRNFLELETNSAFLGAAIVICSNFFFCLKRKIVDSLAARLANLIEMSAVDVSIMANVLFSFVVDEDDLKNLQSTSDNEVD